MSVAVSGKLVPTLVVTPCEWCGHVCVSGWGCCWVRSQAVTRSRSSELMASVTIWYGSKPIATISADRRSVTLTHTHFRCYVSCVPQVRAIQLNPKDAVAHNVMGTWSYSLANLSWGMRLIAKSLFGAPPKVQPPQGNTSLQGA